MIDIYQVIARGNNKEYYDNRIRSKEHVEQD